MVRVRSYNVRRGWKEINCEFMRNLLVALGVRFISWDPHLEVLQVCAVGIWLLRRVGKWIFVAINMTSVMLKLRLN